VATVTARDATNADLSDTATATVTAIQTSGIELTKTADAATYDQVGDVITYTLMVTNTGNETLDNVTLTDPLTGLNQNLGSMPPAQVITVTESYTIIQSDIDAGEVVNVATVTATDATKANLSDTATATIIAIQTSGIELTKTADVATYDQAGDVIIYTLTVTNTGNETLDNVILTDPLTGLNQNLGSMPPSQELSVTESYTITQSDIDAGEVVNVATVTATDATNAVLSDMATATVTGIQTSGIELIKTADVSTYDQVGDVIPYTLMIENMGNTTLTNMVTTDQLTGLVEIVSIIAPGEEVTYTTTYTVTQSDMEAGSISNIASVTALDPSGNSVEDNDSVIVLTDAQPGIEIVKNANKDLVFGRGEIITYSIEVTNTGNVGLTEVHVTDPLTGMDETIDILSPQESVEFITTYTVTQSDIEANGTIVNTAYVSAHNPVGNDLLTDIDEAITQVACNGETLVTGLIYRLGTLSPLPNVPVILIPDANTPGSPLIVLTDNSGRYEFKNIAVGDYTIRVLDENLEITQGLRSVDGDTKPITAEACVYSPVDFRYTFAGSGTSSGAEDPFLRGFVWYDLNGDGIENEWYDANNDGIVTENKIELGQPINIEDWEWFDLNGDGSYDGEENQGELNKAGFGNPEDQNISIKGPNGYEAMETVGRYGFWKHELTQILPYGEYEVTLIEDPVFNTNALAMGGSGLVKVLPDPSGRTTQASEIDELICEVTTPITQVGSVSRDAPTNFNFDYGIRCFTVPDEVNLAVNKTSNGVEIFEGDEFIYEITVTNIGGVDATEVVVSDILPHEVTFLSQETISNPSNSQIIFSGDGSQLIWKIEKLEADETIVIQVRGKAGDPGMITNVVSVSSSEVDSDEIDNQDDDVNTILPFHIPNVITPNQDGDNDSFVIQGIDKFESNEITIFNRLGDHVFETKDYQNDWDANGQPAGTYFYVFNGKDRDGREHEFKGWIQVIKE
jgi:gliding motility-associated-like protein/uncharacterized repeat protein (TIGR01451 family)